MKKIISIFLCILISIAFISCSKNTKEDRNSTNQQTTNSIANTLNNKHSTLSNNSKNDKQDSNIKRIYLDYNGFKVDVDIDNEMISQLDEIENNSTVPETELNTELATINVVYENDTEEVFGTIYIGSDNAFYLKLSNSKNKDVAFKMADSSFANGLF